jgi:flagellar export protein FliJ
MTSPRFKFSLQRLLTMRQKAEREAAIALATAHVAEDAARQTKDALDVRRAEARDAVLPPPGTVKSVAELRQAAFLVEQLDSNLAGARADVAAAERSVQEQQWRLGERVRDRRVLDRLRERQLDSWKVTDARAERDVMDGIARTRFMDKETPVSQRKDPQ